MYEKSNIETYITICKIWLRKLKQGLCINLKGWDGVRDGREVQNRADICTPMTNSC